MFRVCNTIRLVSLGQKCECKIRTLFEVDTRICAEFQKFVCEALVTDPKVAAVAVTF